MILVEPSQNSPLPVFPDIPLNERWVELISRKPSDSNQSVIPLSWYFRLIQKAIEMKKGIAKFLFIILSKYWLQFFYPSLYEKTVDKQESVAIKGQQICIPTFHVWNTSFK